jgi:predicted GH43/DUF377 family glycosyl hydrolase
MRWRKKGLVYAPDGSLGWARAYAYPPTPFAVTQEVIRLYVAFCDENMVGRVGYVDVDATEPSRVLAVSPRPVLDIGVPGTFDENGVVPTCVVPVGDELYLYYVGFQLGVRVRYFQFLGLAVSRDEGESFERTSHVPVLDRTDTEFAHRTAGYVMREDGIFKLWYTAGSEWTVVNDKSLPVYNLRYAESSDGKTWPSEGRVALDFKDDDEHAIGRPWVVREPDGYKMFFSVRTRSKGYRLGYAVSSDGLTWSRREEEIGIDVSQEGWDSEMIAYPSVFRSSRRTYLFYNGNNCGETGFGYAELADDARSSS